MVDKPWIPCTCKADTPNANLQSNIQCREWPNEPDRATAPETVLENPDVAVGVLIYIPVAGPSAVAVTIIVKTPAPVVVGQTPITMANNGTKTGAIVAEMRASSARI